MEVAAVAGLLGLGYFVSRLGAPRGGAPRPMDPSHTTIPALEGFLPAARAPDRDALTQTPKGASAVGFGPELDQMFQYPNGQTYPSEPHPGPYGQPLGYATQQPPLAPLQGRSGQFSPDPVPLEMNKPLVEFRSD